MMRLLLWKEARALMPTLAAAAVTIAIAAAGMRGHVLRDWFAGPIALAAMVFGGAILSAHGIGHEYADRTLSALLAQPVARIRLLAAKLIVAAPATVLLATVFYLALRGQPRLPLPEPVLSAALLAFALAAAPLFTILGRSTLAGSVLTISVIAAAWLGAGVAASAHYDWRPIAEADALQLLLFQRAIVVGFVLAAFGSWRMFARLQALEGTGDAIDIGAWLPRRRSASRATKAGSPTRGIVAAVAKELRLQQLSFVLAVVFAVGWATFRFARPHPSIEAITLIPPLTYLYFGILCLVAGGVASADERQLGTHASQLLLPWPGWLLWTVKIAIVFGVCGLLGGILPVMLIRASAIDIPRGAFDLTGVIAVIVLITTCAIYVSSSASSTVRSVVASVPLAVIAPGAIQFCLSSARHLRPAVGLELAAPRSTGIAVLLTIAAAFVLTLALAYTNHRRVDHSWVHVTFHALAVLGVLFFGPLLLPSLV